MKKNTHANVRGRLLNGEPNPVDVHVGSRVRMRRIILGMSQQRLAKELSVTFQQIQKYERGLNRIGASRLWDLAQVLGVSVDFFYEDLGVDVSNQSPRKLNHPSQLSQDTAIFDMDVLLRKDVLDLIHYYAKIKDPKMAKAILDMARAAVPENQRDNDSKSDTDK